MPNFDILNVNDFSKVKYTIFYFLIKDCMDSNTACYSALHPSCAWGEKKS